MVGAMRRTKDDALTATIEFIDMFDKYFDCLNVKNVVVTSTKRINIRHHTVKRMIFV